MTDKEIFEKLEAEIERLENYENESVTSSDTRFGWIHGKTFALTSIRVFLDSMQKEPKECMYSKDNYTDEDRKVLCDGCEEECIFNKKEEPVSEDLEKEMNDFFLTMQVQDKEYINEDTFRSIARHFAEWQKEQLMAKAVDGVVHHHGNCKVASVYYNDPDNVPMAYYIPSEGVSEGDVVKIITIKED